jgi:PAS domain S-box-containing protein
MVSGSAPDAPLEPVARSAAEVAARTLAGHGPRVAAARRLLRDDGRGQRQRLDALAGWATQLLGATSARIALLSDVHTRVGAAGPQPEDSTDAAPEQLVEWLCTQTAASQRPLAVDDARADERVSDLWPVTVGAVGSYLGVPMHDLAGNVVGAVCVLEPDSHEWGEHDAAVLVQVAAAAAAELELSALEDERADDRALLDLTVAAAQLGTFDLDLASGELSVNDRLLELSGLTRETFSGVPQDVYAHLHPEDLDATVAAVQAAVDSGGTYTAQYRVLGAEGTVTWIAARGAVRPGAAGRPARLLGAVYDITAVREGATRTEAILEDMAVGYLLMDADWVMVFANTEAERVTGYPRRDLLGRSFWDVFPATAGTVFEDSYRRAVAEHVDVVFDAYYPEPLDVWVEVRATPEGNGLALYFIDITTRQHALEARDLAARRLQGIARFTLALGGAQTIADLVRIVTEDGLPELGCDGGAVATFDPDPEPGEERVLLSHLAASYGRDAQAGYARLPLSAPLPVAEAARTAEAVLLPDQDACRAYSPQMAQVVTDTGSVAFASLPLEISGVVLGVVSAGWAQPQSFDAAQLSLLDTFAAQVAQTVQRLDALAAERAAAARVAGMAEALQRSLLTELPEPDHLELVARYVAAADEAQVGGDWYDAFTVRDGTTCVAIGDVTGHDQGAAVQMAQVRNVLRGIAHALVQPPAVILSALDLAMRDLAVGALATAVLAKVEQSPEEAARGLRTLRWSNAGHLSPLLVHPGGRTELLARPSDLLLGLGVDVERHDHTHQLAPGATVLLFTDGLVERRGEDIDDGLARLAAAAAELAHLPLQQLCDELLRRLAVDSEDDVALLAIRAHPEDRPRPAEAGPGRLPTDLTRAAPVFPEEGPAAQR